jgi:hypothetical protein
MHPVAQRPHRRSAKAPLAGPDAADKREAASETVLLMGWNSAETVPGAGRAY